MSKYNNIITTIATFCFSIGLALYICFNKYLFEVEEKGIAEVVILFISAIGIYSLVFSLLLALYRRCLHKYIYNDYNIDGTWYTIMLINRGTDNNEKLVQVRKGTCDIGFSVSDGIEISGEHLELNEDLSSSWSTETADFIGKRLILLYSSDSVSATRTTSKGTIILNLTGAPPSKMTGTWSDIAPSTNRGTTFLYRDKESYERHLDKLIQRHNVD